MLGDASAAFDLSTPYEPIALYLQGSDSVEYVRVDGPCVYERIDAILTLVLDMDHRRPIGFRLKGFRSFYLEMRKTRPFLTDDHFLAAVAVLEQAATKVGAELADHLDGYKVACEIALTDNVQISDLPKVA